MRNETQVLFVDAARYWNRGAYAVSVVDAHGSLVNAATRDTVTLYRFGSPLCFATQHNIVADFEELFKDENPPGVKVTSKLDNVGDSPLNHVVAFGCRPYGILRVREIGKVGGDEMGCVCRVGGGLVGVGGVGVPQDPSPAALHTMYPEPFPSPDCPLCGVYGDFEHVLWGCASAGPPFTQEEIKRLIKAQDRISHILAVQRARARAVMFNLMVPDWA
ncbi:hypothetical protein HPB52_025240 [Rhipicephalus sanguineus]|uniref:Uncharacterized protein n=1 Tax=Rhipicephalus sanguineus TaxID=34632 RepID=A0A9D4P906_RHISA|nr:hypothetical protein HPB52_025240 [Rhipicephalus sanguineus]